MKQGYGKLIGKITLAMLLMLASTIIFTIIGNVLTPNIKNLGYIWSQMGLFLSAFVMYRWFDRNQGWSFGLRDNKALSSILIGAFIATLIPTIGAFIMMGTNSISLTRNDVGASIFLMQLLVFIVVAVGEEVFFRGYLFGMIQQAASARSAVIITSILFGFIHLMNPNGFDKPMAHIVIEITSIMLAGWLFGLARLYSGSLWLPIGLHLFMNFVQSGVLGFLNGGKDVDSIFEITYVNKTIWNGSGYGFESSFICIPILIVAMLVVKVIFTKVSKFSTVPTYVER